MLTREAPHTHTTPHHTTPPTRRQIYQHLFQEGVLVAKKDFNAPKHMELDIPNLQVIKALQSMTSKGYVVTRFSWQYYYYYLTNEGIEFLRGVLGLPMEIVPRTFIKTKAEVRRRLRVLCVCACVHGVCVERSNGRRERAPALEAEQAKRRGRPGTPGQGLPAGRTAHLEVLAWMTVELIRPCTPSQPTQPTEEKPARDERPRTARPDGDYKRRGDEAGKKESSAPTGDFRPQFRGGLAK